MVYTARESVMTAEVEYRTGIFIKVFSNRDRPRPALGIGIEFGRPDTGIDSPGHVLASGPCYRSPGKDLSGDEHTSYPILADSPPSESRSDTDRLMTPSYQEVVIYTV